MNTYHGYIIDDSKWQVKGGNGQINTAMKDGETYFVKRLGKPKYPESSNFSGEYKKAKIAECDEWLRRRKAIAKALPGEGFGNIIKPKCYFREGPCFYEVTNLVRVDQIPYDQVWKESVEEKAMLMMTIAMSLRQIHDCGIIHGDLDPNNILISRSQAGRLITKIIDFTDAFFADDIPDSIMSKDAWWSPEVAVYSLTKGADKEKYKKTISTKADVFSLGLIFHQYCTGGEFPKHSGNYPYNQLLDGGVLKADTSIDPFFQNLINNMLKLYPDERPSMQEIHSRLRDFLDRLKNGDHDSSIDEVKPVTPIEPSVTSGIRPTGKKTSSGETIVSAKRHERNPARKVVLTLASGKEQIMDFNFAKNLGLIEEY